MRNLLCLAVVSILGCSNDDEKARQGPRETLRIENDTDGKICITSSYYRSQRARYKTRPVLETPGEEWTRQEALRDFENRYSPSCECPAGYTLIAQEGEGDIGPIVCLED
jgi:hypothetical protein